MQTDDTQLAVLGTKLDRVQDDIKEIKDTMGNRYVTQEEFRPIKTFVYGLIGITLTAIGVSIINLVVHK